MSPRAWFYGMGLGLLSWLLIFCVGFLAMGCGQAPEAEWSMDADPNMAIKLDVDPNQKYDFHFKVVTDNTNWSYVEMEEGVSCEEITRRQYRCRCTEQE